MLVLNIIIYLNVSLDILLKWIKMCGREIEWNIDFYYFVRLSDDYEKVMLVFE